MVAGHKLNVWHCNPERNFPTILMNRSLYSRTTKVLLKSMRIANSNAVICLLFFQPALAQEEPAEQEPTRILSKLSPVLFTEPDSPRAPIEFEVESVQYDKNQERTVRLCLVKPPVLPEPPKEVPLTQEQSAALKEQMAQIAAENPAEETTFIILASTTYNGQLSRLWWWQNGELCVAWSSIDFKYLSGFTEFRVEGKRYSLLLMHSNTEIENLPDHPPLPAEGYTLDQDNPENVEDMPSILHKLYAVEEARLKIAYGERVQYFAARKAAQEAELAERAESEVVIHFWPKKTTHFNFLIDQE